ncbi:MAG: efflux RND transporter periplasmic adaptor subunit, partial [Anaerolineales bacterium]|nr:efflux RND transporter periplasmic adaptor subunit [Anaerolineales bacterium]
MKTRKTILYVLMGLSVLLTLSACGGRETPTPEPVEEVSLDFVVAEGHIIPTRDVRLNFAAQGPVEEILVQEGESVTRDQALMTLGDRQAAEASLEAAELELTRAEQDYDDFLRTGDLAAAQAWQDYLEAQIRRAEAERAWEDLDLDQLEDDIDEAQGEVNEREQDLEDAEEEFDIYKDLDEDNADRQNAEDDLEEAREEYNEALRDL